MRPGAWPHMGPYEPILGHIQYGSIWTPYVVHIGSKVNNADDAGGGIFFPGNPGPIPNAAKDNGSR